MAGIRASADTFIYVDVPRALAAGIPFELSANGVVLSRGDPTGVIPATYFSRVLDRQGRDMLPT